MKILQIGMGNIAGGLEAFVMNYYRELSSMGVEFDFLCMYDKIAYEEEILRLGGHVFYVPNVKKNYFGYVKGLRKILEKGSYTAVHVNMLSAANIVPLKVASRYKGLHVIAHCHSTSCPGLIRKTMDGWNRQILKHYATDYFACSEKSGAWMFGKSTQESGKVHLIHNAIDLTKFTFSEAERMRLRREMGWQDRMVIGHVGRFDIPKNHAGMIDIFAEIVKQEPKALLCFVGGKDGLYPQILDMVQKKGLNDHVVFAGVRNDVGALLSAMDAFLFPSRFEGAPFALVEAQANGLSCVISDVIPREIDVLPEKIHRLSLQDDKNKWADTVLTAAKSKRTEQKRIAEAMGEKHFDISSEAAYLKKLYQEMDT